MSMFSSTGAQLGPVIVIHGGAGTISRSSINAGQEAAYHAALQDELQRLKSEYGHVLLWEGHSIRGELPFLFDGRLPDLNLGTAGGTSCTPHTQARIEAVLDAQSAYSHVVNGRFKGGHITRHYGRPDDVVEAVQLEISQRCYMDEESFAWDADKAARLQPVLRRLLEAALASA